MLLFSDIGLQIQNNKIDLVSFCLVSRTEVLLPLFITHDKPLNEEKTIKTSLYIYVYHVPYFLNVLTDKDCPV
jgi:hypothetical protein